MTGRFARDARIASAAARPSEIAWPLRCARGATRSTRPHTSGNGRAAKGSLEAHRRPHAPGPRPARPSPDQVEVSGRVGLRLAPEQVEHEPADLPAVPGPPQLVVVPADQHLRGLRVIGEYLVGGVVHQCPGVVALHVDVVDAEQVVLPDHRRDRLRDPARDRVAPNQRLGVPVLRPQVVGQGAAEPFGVESVDSRRVAVEDVGDVDPVLDRTDREDRRVGAGRRCHLCHL